MTDAELKAQLDSRYIFALSANYCMERLKLSMYAQVCGKDHHYYSLRSHIGHLTRRLRKIRALQDQDRDPVRQGIADNKNLH